MPDRPESLPPIDEIVLEVLRPRLASRVGKPLVVGLSGAQGSGKSTLAEALRRRLENDGRRVVILSLDNLYLTHAERLQLAASVHPLLRTRGPPGTHDVGLGERVLEGLGAAARTLMPRFDKAADDRRPEADWTAIDPPTDVVLFEGWCVGARPQEGAALAAPVNELEAMEDPDGLWRRWVNGRLAQDYPRLFGRIDLLVLLAAPGFEVVAGWRDQQEEDLGGARLAAGEPVEGLLEGEALVRFIQHYERLTRHILAEMPARADLVIRLDEARQPTAVIHKAYAR